MTMPSASLKFSDGGCQRGRCFRAVDPRVRPAPGKDLLRFSAMGPAASSRSALLKRRIKLLYEAYLRGVQRLRFIPLLTVWRRPGAMNEDYSLFPFAVYL